MAVKIIRQPKKIALLGSASSAAALKPGRERSPAALRAAGLADRLKAAGFDVVDHGDTATQVFQADEEHPRARNLPGVLKSLNDLRPRVEVAVKSGALPLVLCGDCISVLATVAAVRRYYRNVSLIYVDRDVSLKVPATTTSGCVDGMVISQVIGRGAPELTRFWGEPPLVREPDITLFGFDLLDPLEEKFLLLSSLRRHPALEISAVGAAAAARTVLETVHSSKHELVLHLDVDVLSSGAFGPADFPAAGGLTRSEVREALRVFARQPNLAALEVAGYDPDLDTNGETAQRLVDLLVEILSARLDTESVAPEAPAVSEPLSSGAAHSEAGTPADSQVPTDSGSIAP